uniref:Uncharacterized protein n=1 Tax=Anguilla anguilla TaxID=7936 RepID=A0A0E9XE54_ANGAN
MTKHMNTNATKTMQKNIYISTQIHRWLELDDAEIIFADSQTRKLNKSVSGERWDWIGSPGALWLVHSVLPWTPVPPSFSLHS